MEIPVTHRPARGQTSLEYLLLLAIVAVVVIAGFGPGSLISQVHDAAEGYYNSVTRVIMGETPTPIKGGWCQVTCPSGFGPKDIYGACECPAPAFGGAPCDLTINPTCDAGKTCPGGFKVSCNNVTECGACPTGQVCVNKTVNNPTGCACPNGLVCGGPPNSGPPGSIASTDCTQCLCPYGWYFDQSLGSCENYCPNPCTTFLNGTCVAVTCQPNSSCDPTKPVNVECQCWRNYYWNGNGCAPIICAATSSAICNVPVLSTSGTPSCTPINCADSFGLSFCDVATNSCGCDQLTDQGAPMPTYWNGRACVLGTCPVTTPCPGGTTNNAKGDPTACGKDNCGTYCGSQVDNTSGLNNGTCQPGYACNNSTGGPGTCVSKCLATEIWNGTGCVPLTPCGSNNCGQDSDKSPCGSNGGGCSSDSSGCSSGDTSDHSKLPPPGLCCLGCQTVDQKNNACKTTTPCGIDWNNDCGFDSCGNACGPNKGGCSTGTCSSTTGKCG